MNKEKIQLIKYFGELYIIEKNARNLYNEFLDTLKDHGHIKIVKEIRDDEEKHMKIVKEIIKIVESD